VNVSVEVYEVRGLTGEVLGVSARAVIEHSPRDGYDNEKLRVLENRLTDILREGLNDALLKNGGEE